MCESVVACFCLREEKEKEKKKKVFKAKKFKAYRVTGKKEVPR